MAELANCSRCGADIIKGRLCTDCAVELKTDLERYEKWKEQHRFKLN